MSLSFISENLKDIRKQMDVYCEKYNRKSTDVELIAVSKTKPESYIEAALEAGQVHFGENKIQDLCAKMEHFDDKPIWHMIGTLQSNKVKYMVERVDWIHSVPKLKTLKEIEKRAAAVERTIHCLIQVNISDEDQKSGCDPKDLENMIVAAKEMPHIKLMGLMGVATFTDDQEQIRTEFKLLRSLRDEMAEKHNGGNIELKHLSMGMSSDMEIAIEEGATMIRIGTAIFGARDYSK